MKLSDNWWNQWDKARQMLLDGVTGSLPRDIMEAATEAEISQFVEETPVEWDSYDMLKAEVEMYRAGYKGACYACEPVGELNVKLEAKIARLREFYVAHKPIHGQSWATDAEWIRFESALLALEVGDGNT